MCENHEFEYVGLTEYELDAEDADRVAWQVETVKALWRCADEDCRAWGITRLTEDDQVPTDDHDHDEYEYQEVGIVESHKDNMDYAAVKACAEDGCDAWAVHGHDLDLADRVFPTNHPTPSDTR